MSFSIPGAGLTERRKGRCRTQHLGSPQRGTPLEAVCSMAMQGAVQGGTQTAVPLSQCRAGMGCKIPWAYQIHRCPSPPHRKAQLWGGTHQPFCSLGTCSNLHTMPTTMLTWLKRLVAHSVSRMDKSPCIFMRHSFFPKYFRSLAD